MSVKISQLPEITANELSLDDVVPIVDLNPLGTPRTKRADLTALFTKAPVKSVNGLATGDVSLASTNLTDASTIGRILNINGFSTGDVSLGSSHLSDSSDIALHSNLGTTSAFTTEYNNPTTSALQTEYEELARLLGNDVGNVRTSLFAVQTTANNAMPTATANNTFATKTSLSNNYLTSTQIAGSYYNKTESDNTFVTQTSLSNNYSTSTQIANSYATQTYVANQISNLGGTNVSIFSVVGLDATGSVSIGGNLAVSTNLSIGQHITCTDLTALDLIKGLRAEIGDGTPNKNRLTIKGDADFQGKLQVDKLEVQGQMIVHSSQVVQIEDDFIEVNRKQDGTNTAGVAGLHINRGGSIDKAIFQWHESNSSFELKVGTSLAGLDAGAVKFKNTYPAVTNLPTATAHQGMFAYEQTSAQAIFSNGTKWASIIDSDQMGTTTDFDTAFQNALG